MLIGLNFNAIQPYMGEEMMLRGFVIIIVGGLGDIRGALIAGLLLGVIEVLTAGYLESEPEGGGGFRDPRARAVDAPIRPVRPRRGAPRMTMPPWLDDFLWTYQNVVHSLGINGLLALSMYVVLAVGQLSLGQAAFMGLGAYSSALMTLKLGWPFWVGASRLLRRARRCSRWRSACRRCASPAIYLAIATIGLGEVLRAVYLNVDYLGGALGLSGIPERAETWMIYLLLAIADRRALADRAKQHRPGDGGDAGGRDGGAGDGRADPSLPHGRAARLRHARRDCGSAGRACERASSGRTSTASSRP